MGKIVKYCAVCDESFAEKFAFCPNCAQPMTAFEMNPVMKAEPVAETVNPSVKADEPVFQTSEPTFFRDVPSFQAASIASAPVAGTFAVSDAPTQNFSSNVTVEDVPAAEPLIEEPPIEEPPVEDPPVETKTFAAAAGVTRSNDIYQTNGNADRTPVVKADQSDDGFNVTVIEDKNGKQRNALLLGSMALILSLALGGTVYSLFNKEMGVGAIEGGDLFAAVIVEEVPVEIEEPPKVKEKDDGGGGGGGGKEEPEPASKGRLVSQSENPITPPDAKSVQLTNPDIKLVYETKGTIKRPVTEERPGLPGSDNLNPSNGTGRGGGIGSGNGTGIGGGNGTGEGNGNGSGSGNGNGNGNGDGTGNGSGTRPPPAPVRPPPPVEVVTIPFRIISKPRPGYTDAARQNQVTGVVRLKVTFLASGAIGSIAPVSGLPYGLTEQAISAARQIKFEPQKKNGSAVAVTKTIEYSFSIY